MADKIKMISLLVLETVVDSTIRALGKYTFDKGLRALALWWVKRGALTQQGGQNRDIGTESDYDFNVERGQQTSFSIRDIGVQTRGVWFYSKSTSIRSEDLQEDVEVGIRRLSSVRSSTSSPRGSVGTQVEAQDLVVVAIGPEENGKMHTLEVVGKMPNLSPDEEVLFSKASSETLDTINEDDLNANDGSSNTDNYEPKRRYNLYMDDCSYI